MTKLKQLLSIYAPAVCLMLLADCTDGVPDGRSRAKNEALTLNFRINDPTAQSALRATVSPTEGETGVTSLHLLFFNASGDRSGTLAGTVSIAGEREGMPGATGKLTMQTSYILPQTGDIDPAQAYHIIGIANLGEYVNAGEWLARWIGQTETFFRDNATLVVIGTDDENDYTAHRPLNPAALPINGYADKPAGTKDIQMALSRNVARFDVQNNAATTHTLQTISVWNAFEQSSVMDALPFDYASEAMHTKRLYGIATPDDAVKGSLYAFSNHSAKPAINDKITTCLIIGLKKTGDAKRYYRLNVNTGGAGQHIKDNYAYNITILSVTGEGYPSENEAWEGTTNQLIHTVNNWDFDDNGLIVSDENSVLSLPVKTVKFGSQGGERSYSITTFTTLANPAPLRIKSQLYDPDDGNIAARIANGNLVIDALPVNTGEEKRTGIVTVSFAGLETTVNVLQTAAGDIFLEATLDDEWEECLPPTANAMSECVYVKASGPWTAQIYGSPNFAFLNSLGNYVTKIASAECTKNKLHIYTSATNGSKTDTNKGFALISLDSDPTVYIAVIPLCQSPKGGIDTHPENLEAIDFSVNGKLKASVAGNMIDNDNQVFKYKVSSATGSIGAGDVKLVGADYDKFEYTFDPIDAASGYVTVKTKDYNNSPAAYIAALTVNDNRNGSLLVTITQDPLIWSIDLDNAKFSAKGGTGIIKITINDDESTWTAQSVTGPEGGTKAIFLHDVVVKAGENPASEESNSTILTVIVPKIYYPNRDVDIKATVTVTLKRGQTKTVELTQNRLTPKGVRIWSLRNDKYGGLGSSATNYIMSYYNAIKNIIEGNQGSNYWNTNSISNPSASYPLGTTYIHTGNQFVLGTDANNWSWTNITNFLNMEDGIFVMTADSKDGTNLSIYNNFFSGIGSYGSNPIAATDNARINVPGDIGETRIGMFLTTKGFTPIPNPNSTISDFGGDPTRTYMKQGNIPRSGIAVLTNPDKSMVFMAIDPEKRFVYLGESQVFDSSSNLGGNRGTFMNNFVQYVGYAAQYGSHFTDMLVDGSPVPEPWSVQWGTNAWPN